VATPTDSGQLAPAAERVAEVLEVQPPAKGESSFTVTLLADAGYSSANDAVVRGCGAPPPHRVACEKLGLAPVFPVTRTVNPHGDHFDRSAFIHDGDKDRMICPAGKELKPLPKPSDGAIVYKAKRTDCAACLLKPRCTTAKRRNVSRLLNEDALDRVTARLATDPGLMHQRAQSVEPAFATIKRWMHGGRFLLRGKSKATTEITLISLAFNLKRLANIHGTPRLLQALA
jgi:transposase